MFLSIRGFPQLKNFLEYKAGDHRLGMHQKKRPDLPLDHDSLMGSSPPENSHRNRNSFSFLRTLQFRRKKILFHIKASRMKKACGTFTVLPESHPNTIPVSWTEPTRKRYVVTVCVEPDTSPVEIHRHRFRPSASGP